MANPRIRHKPDADQHGDEGFEFANLEDHSNIFELAEQIKQQQTEGT